MSTTGLVQLVVAPSQYAHNLGPRCPRRICSVNERGDVSGQSVHGNMGHGGWLRRGDQISGVSRNEAATKRRNKNHRITRKKFFQGWPAYWRGGAPEALHVDARSLAWRDRLFVAVREAYR